MKQTVNVNLGGIAFCIDEDAYQELDAYLNDIRKHLGSESVQEIMQDIEARIAELFEQHKKYSHMNVITLMMVEDVEKQLGSAEAIGGEEEAHADLGAYANVTNEDKEDKENIEDKGEDNQQKKRNKKLYRDVDNATIGGVCAGLSKWVGIDTIWVRLVMLLLLVFQGAGVLTYLLLWIIVPAANTAARRLEMRGIEPSVDAIKTEVESNPQKYAAGTNTTSGTNGGCLAASGCLIALALLLGFPLLLLAFVLLTVFGAVSGAMNVAFLGVPAMLLKGGLISALSGLLFILVPIIILVVWLIRRNSSNHPLSKTFLVVMLILWLLSLIGLTWGGKHAIQSAADVDWNELELRLDSAGAWMEQHFHFEGVQEDAEYSECSLEMMEE